MQVLKRSTAEPQVGKRFDEACRFLTACAEAEMKKMLGLRAGLTPSDHAEILRYDGDLASTVLQAFPQQHSPDFAATLGASLKVWEKMRVAESLKLQPLHQQYIARSKQLQTILNLSADSNAEKGLADLSSLDVKLDQSRNEIADIRCRARSFFGRSVGMTSLGMTLLASDMGLLYNNFSVLVTATGLEDLTSILASGASTTIVALVFLLLTHLGLAPLFRKALELIEQRRESEHFLNAGVPEHSRAALAVILTSSALTFLVAFIIASLREDQVVSSGSGAPFIALTTLGLPILSLFIHLCFQVSSSHWKSYREMHDRYLDAVQPLRDAESTLVRAEVQERKSKPVCRELKRLSKTYDRHVMAAYKRVSKHPSVKSEIDRLAKMLIAPPPSVLQPSPANDSASNPLPSPQAVTQLSSNDNTNDRSDSLNSVPNSDHAKVSAVSEVAPVHLRNGKSVKQSSLLGLLLLAYMSHGCGSKHVSNHTVALMDDTKDFVASQGANAAWNDGIHRVKDTIPSMVAGGTVEVYTMADAHNCAPACRVSWLKDMEEGKVIVSARVRKDHLSKLDVQLNGLLTTVRAHPTTSQTRMIETIYELLRTRQNQQGASSDDLVVITSDMEPFTHTLTASRIVQSDQALAHYSKEVSSTYRSLGAGLPKIVVVYSPSVGMLKLPPDCMGRLKTFWLTFFEAVGCKHVDWVSPRTQVTSPILTESRSR